MAASAPVNVPTQSPQHPHVLKISPQEYQPSVSHYQASYTYTSTYGNYSAVSTSPTSPGSAQGSHCCGCGGMFVISNRCSNRECKHLQCTKCT